MITMTSVEAPRARVAVISLHTSPLDQPGTGDSGGMNVEIRALAGLLGDRGVAVDIFTRGAGPGVPDIEPVGSLARVIQVRAGPLEARLGPYDLVHSHYWMSGPAGVAAAARWEVPLIASLHTLAEVKNLVVEKGDPLEPLARVAGEKRLIRAADRVLAPTREDSHNLIELYGADPARIRVVPPGVDAGLFHPRDQAEARERLGIGPGPVVLFVGRLQRLKGPDIAIRAFAEATRREPATMRDATLVLVGGPSGPAAGSVRAWLEGVVTSEGLDGRVRFLPPRAHDDMPWVYAAADILIMPSRSESFGLAALEAQACGTPVVAAAVGGLEHAVGDGTGGLLVRGRGPGDYAGRLLRVLTSPRLKARLSRGAVYHASAFPWTRTVDGLLDVYGELVPDLGSAKAS
jgi:D-inositol-3-phosphate glycosyltransferase